PITTCQANGCSCKMCPFHKRLSSESRVMWFAPILVLDQALALAVLWRRLAQVVRRRRCAVIGLLLLHRERRNHVGAALRVDHADGAVGLLVIELAVLLPRAGDAASARMIPRSDASCSSYPRARFNPAPLVALVRTWISSSTSALSLIGSSN